LAIQGGQTAFNAPDGISGRFCPIAQPAVLADLYTGMKLATGCAMPVDKFALL
jgi:hypothetical protein